MSKPHNASPDPTLTTPASQQQSPTDSHQQQATAVGLELPPDFPSHAPNAQTGTPSPPSASPQSTVSFSEGISHLHIARHSPTVHWNHSWDPQRNTPTPPPTTPGPHASTFLPSPPALMRLESEQALDYLRRSARRVNALRKNLLEPSRDTSTAQSTRDPLHYARSRGSDNTQEMTSANTESVKHGQVWRMAAVIVQENLLKIEDRSEQKMRKKVKPFLAFPSVIRAQCAIVWRDIYDMESAKTDQLSICTTIEAAAAGRTAYNWLNNRHRLIISGDVDGYIKAVIQVIKTEKPVQHKSCAINKLPICFGRPDENITPNVEVIKQLADLTILEHLEALENDGRKKRTLRPLMDHHNQVAMFHMRGQWGGDLTIANETRRRSEVLNYVAHGSIAFVYEEIRTCPCQAEKLITSMVETTVQKKDIVTCDDILKEPGLVRFRRGRVILSLYIAILLVSACAVITLSVRATSEGFEKVSGVLSGWSWSLALVSAVHFLIIRNMLPGTTLRHLGQGKRQARDLCDMKLEKGVLILLAQDARTNHLLGQGNACAYANRPSGKVQVSEMPSGLEAWQLGLVVTDKFAIKLQQNTPLIRKTVENLDGSIHVDWDEAVEDGIVGRLLGKEVRVGKEEEEEKKSP